MAMFSEPKIYNEKEIESLIRYISKNNNANNVKYIEQTNFHVKFQGVRDSQKIIFNFDKKDGFLLEDTE